MARSQRYEDAVKFQVQLILAQRNIGGLFISKDIQDRANALGMLLRIAEAEINAVIRYEAEKEAERSNEDE